MVPKYTPMKKSAAAKLQTRNLGTSILLLEKIRTKTTVPLPSMANRKTTQTPHLKVHQSNKSWQGRNGPNWKMKIILVSLKTVCSRRKIIKLFGWPTRMWKTLNLFRTKRLTRDGSSTFLIFKVLLDVRWQIARVYEVRPKVIPKVVNLRSKFVTQVIWKKW